MAINCDILTGIPKDCDGNRGSILKLYVADELSVTATTQSASTYTAIAADTDFVEVVFNRNAANYTTELSREEVAGARTYTQTISCTIPRREIAKRNSIMLLGEGDRELFIIALDGNGIYWAFRNMILTGVGGGSGENRAAGSTFTLTFTGEAQELESDIDSTIISALIS